MDIKSDKIKQSNILLQNDKMIDKIKDAFTHTSVTVGAPVSAGLVGLIDICRQLAPVLTVISLITGIILGIMSYRLKKKLVQKKVSESDKIVLD